MARRPAVSGKEETNKMPHERFFEKSQIRATVPGSTQTCFIEPLSVAVGSKYKRLTSASYRPTPLLYAEQIFCTEWIYPKYWIYKIWGADAQSTNCHRHASRKCNELQAKRAKPLSFILSNKSLFILHKNEKIYQQIRKQLMGTFFSAVWWEKFQYSCILWQAQKW